MLFSFSNQSSLSLPTVTRRRKELVGLTCSLNVAPLTEMACVVKTNHTEFFSKYTSYDNNNLSSTITLKSNSFFPSPILSLFLYQILSLKINFVLASSKSRKYSSFIIDEFLRSQSNFGNFANFAILLPEYEINGL